MKQIALICGSLFIYWSDVVTALAAATAICIYLSVMCSDGRGKGAAVSLPVAVLFSLAFSRLLHWYCRADQYDSFLAAMTSISGGHALAGAFAGCLLAALLLRLVRLTEDLPRMLDAMAIAGCAGIATGRLACFFNSEDRGMPVSQWTQLPWAYPVTNPVSGAEEIRLATFFLQSLVSAALFGVLLFLWRRNDRKKSGRNGDICLIFLLCYGASQVILDSTRYDSLHLRSNGFVSLVQVLGACAMIPAAVIFSLRLVRQRGWKRWYPLLWMLLAGLLGLAGCMEYFVQRWSGRSVLGYGIMAAALAAAVGLVLLIRWLSSVYRMSQGGGGDHGGK